LLANYPLVVASGDPESLHQSRVAIRRLRAAFSLFGDVVDDEAAAVLRAELKAVAKGLGPARDLQALLDQIASDARSGNHATAELQAHLGARRVAAMQSAQALLGAGPFQRLLFELAGWIEDGEWLARKGETGGDQPLAPFATRVLSRRRRKLRRHDGLANMLDTTRHRLRIDTKKLRYAGEFFTSLFRDKASVKHRQAFAKTLERLQDSLGELNDMVVAAAGRTVLFEDLKPITAARLEAQFESHLDSPGKSQRKLLNAAEQSLTKVADAPAWWKAG
jgi:CHAD domain-containing protein